MDMITIDGVQKPIHIGERSTRKVTRRQGCSWSLDRGRQRGLQDRQRPRAAVVRPSDGGSKEFVQGTNSSVGRTERGTFVPVTRLQHLSCIDHRSSILRQPTYMHLWSWWRAVSFIIILKIKVATPKASATEQGVWEPIF